MKNESKRMAGTRGITAIVAALSLWTLAAAESRAASAPAPRDDGWEIALDSNIPGKGGWTTCYTFAKALQKRFNVAGGESHVVIYDWTDVYHFHDRHAFLVYRDAAGRYWGVDNRSLQPRWLTGTTPAQWAAFWDNQKDVTLVADLTNKKLAGRTADKSRLDRTLLAAK